MTQNRDFLPQHTEQQREGSVGNLQSPENSREEESQHYTSTRPGKHKARFSSVQFIRSVVSDSLRPHESQHARPPCPSPSPGVHSDSRPSSRWCHPAIVILCRPLLLLPPIPPRIRVFSNKPSLRTRWPKPDYFGSNPKRTLPAPLPVSICISQSQRGRSCSCLVFIYCIEMSNF